MQLPTQQTVSNVNREPAAKSIVVAQGKVADAQRGHRGSCKLLCSSEGVAEDSFACRCAYGECDQPWTGWHGCEAHPGG